MKFLYLFLSVLIVTLVGNYVLGECPNIISREEWNAAAPHKKKDLSEDPVSYIVIRQSTTMFCNSKDSCRLQVQHIQRNHMKEREWDDIAYNFLIGGDGTIFEGRGWGVRGDHSRGYNDRSIGVCLLGDFIDTVPYAVQMNALRDLVRCAEEKKKVRINYEIIGISDFEHILCPEGDFYDVREAACVIEKPLH